ncbi:MAG: tRNA (adenosine(37)-N6)-threonylcarbamoyltransferase complex transferase subunit TsaD [Candidatus Shapirobacteria bacterium]
MRILAIETSADDTCAAVLENDRVITSVISSQTDLHSEWGGIVPDIAKRNHMANILPVIAKAITGMTNYQKTISPSETDFASLRNFQFSMKSIDVIAVTKGPGLAIALSVGMKTAKELAIKYKKKLVAVNHVEGHILANFLKNREGKPERKIEFPALVLTASGGHTKIILIEKIGSYQTVGETLDDAAGEALDKAGKLLGLGYPGGPVIERLAEGGQIDWLKLPRPMAEKKILDYSFSGLKTSFYYQIKDWPKEKISQNLANLCASFQEAVFEHLERKFSLAIEKYQPRTLLGSGGVMANLALRKRLRKLAKEKNLPIYFPTKKQFNTDNAAMIGIAGYYKAMRGEFVEDVENLDIEARMRIS